MIEYIKECSESYNKTHGMTIDYYEKCLNDFDKNVSLANIKVINESGTESDYEYLYEAAVEEFIEKTKKVLTSLYDTLNNFIQKIIKSINDNTIDKYLLKIEKKIESEPDKRDEYNNTEISVPNIDFSSIDVKKLNTFSLMTITRKEYDVDGLNKLCNDMKSSVNKSMKTIHKIKISDGILEVKAYYRLISIIKVLNIKKYDPKLTEEELKKLVELFRVYSNNVKWLVTKISTYSAIVAKKMANRIGA
jgi:hypothetical protein